jgi:hypothetical protein
MDDTLYSHNSYLRDFWSITNRSGNYAFRRVPPGRYIIGVNLRREPDGRQPFPPTFYPGVLDRPKARIVQLGLGEKKSLIDIHMVRQFHVVTLTGTLRFSNGLPVRDGFIELSNTSQESPGAVSMGRGHVDSAGHFSLPLLSGQRGWLHVKAYADTTMRGFTVTNPDPVEFDPHRIVSPLTLTVDLRSK